MLQRSMNKTSLRFLTLTLAPSGVDRWFVRNDKHRKNVISTERSDERSQKNKKEISPYGRNDKHVHRVFCIYQSFLISCRRFWIAMQNHETMNKQ